MTRRITLTIELPEEVCHALEQRAAAEGRLMDEVVTEYVASRNQRMPAVSQPEVARRLAALEHHFGEWASGDADSSANDRIDADLGHEYGRE